MNFDGRKFSLLLHADKVDGIRYERMQSLDIVLWLEMVDDGIAEIVGTYFVMVTKAGEEAFQLELQRRTNDWFHQKMMKSYFK